MPVRASAASSGPTVVAPDGIAIHAFDLPGATGVGVAEGRIPRGRFAIHRHLTIEQYTYVLTGTLTVVVGAEAQPVQAVQLEPGDLILTSPGESIEFINEKEESARVLFICAPPYPADDSDTRLLSVHRPPSREEQRDAIGRLEALRAAVNRAIDARLSDLRCALDAGGPQSPAVPAAERIQPSQ